MEGQIYPTGLQLNKANSLEMFLGHIPMMYIFLRLFVLQECALTLMTLLTESYFWLLGY